MGPSRVRNLVLVLGDQLDDHGSALVSFDRERDRIWMAEVSEESTHVWSHQARIALFLSAMRHFADRLRKRGYVVDYTKLSSQESDTSTLARELESAIKRHRPTKIILTEPGDWRVEQSIREVADRLNQDLEIRPDTHFLVSKEQFREHAEGRKQLRLEYFYREMRRKTGYLMEGIKPLGGSWNFDSDNRESFPKKGMNAGPGDLPRPRGFTPDSMTAEVLHLVSRRFDSHPGRLAQFDWPVTREDALRALDDFCERRLRFFGRYQDAMWEDQPYLYHSRLSAAMNLKLLSPREVIERAVKELDERQLPLPSVEGFVRQILGWREYVRGIYWLWMPEYLHKNALDACHNLPRFYWTAETEMNCLRSTLQQTLDYGYAHHIQRLMVTGLYALLLGVQPRQVHEWYLAVYVDAVEWVELPNTLGMSQYADGGQLASKPYVATGKYVERMSNYCRGCRFKPQLATGPDACPFTTLYWNFLGRHGDQLANNPRMTLQVKNWSRKSPREQQEIQQRAGQLREQVGFGL